MVKTIRINGISENNINGAVRELREYATWVRQKEAELITKLAERGRDVANIKFTGARYDGNNDVTVRVEPTADGAAIYAEGTAVAFIEFGSGSAMGYGHPWPIAGDRPMGPGTWSRDPDVGKGHWDDPNGWYYAHGKKTHGNPPAMAMYDAAQAIVAELTTIAREVFGTS